MAVLNCVRIKSSLTIYLYNRKFDWCLIVDPIWLVWHTYISHWSTEPPRTITYPTRRLRGIFFCKKITQWTKFNIKHHGKITVLPNSKLFLCKKKTLLVSTSSMLWTGQWMSQWVSEWEMYVCHTNQIASTINSQSNFLF